MANLKEKAPTFDFDKADIDQKFEEEIAIKENVVENQYFRILIEKGVILQTPKGQITKKIALYDTVDCDSKDVELLIKKLES